jgi:hypothetical protein
VERWKVEVKPRTQPYLNDDRYRLIDRKSFIGGDVVKVECDAAAANDLRQHPDVLAVGPDDGEW